MSGIQPFHQYNNQPIKHQQKSSMVTYITLSCFSTTRLAISPIHQFMTSRFLLKAPPMRSTVTANRSDWTNLRGPWCILAFVYSIALAGALFGLPTGADKWSRHAVFTLLGTGNALAQGLNDAWVNINATTATQRSLGLALVVIGSNLGPIAGQQLFRSEDAPRYTRAFFFGNSFALCGIDSRYVVAYVDLLERE
jgi:hypothetical protein